MKILAIKLRAIGDTVIWTSALKALHMSFPEAELHVLTYAGNAPVLSNLAYIDKIHTLKGKGRAALFLKLVSLRKEKFDWLLGFHATTSLTRLARMAGAKQTAIHHHSRKSTPSGSVAIPEPGKLEDAISRDYQVLRAIQARCTIHEATQISLTPVEAEAAEARVRTAILGVGGDPGKSRFLFLPGASHFLRRYPFDLWWPQVLKVRDQGEYQPLVMCDGELAGEWDLKQHCRRERIPLIAGGGLRDFLANISRGHKALANDSGPGHMAVALGLETSFIFGPGCVGDWHCYDRKRYPIYRVAVDCRMEGPRDQEQFQFCTVQECAHQKCLRLINFDLSL